MIDESFYTLNEMLAEAASMNEELINNGAGVRSYIYELEFETPVELDVFVNEEGKVSIGSIPPLYRVDTTFKPSFHSVKVVFVKNDEENIS